MKIEKITKNQLKSFAQLKLKKYRQQHKQVLVEGLRTIKQLHNNNIAIEHLFVSTSTESYAAEIKAKNTYILEDWQFDKLASTKTPQTIAGVVKVPQRIFPTSGFQLYLDDIKEPGNLGTIFRTASAAGVSGIILSPDCCDIFNPKVVRSSLGTVFIMASKTLSRNDFLADNRFKIAAVMGGDCDIFAVNTIPSDAVLVIGSEAFGINHEIIDAADLRVSIPMANDIESLNAAIAMGILTFNLLDKINKS